MSDRIAHYNILSTIGSGAQGTVYRARDTVHGRTVAIRVLTEGMNDPAQRARALDLVQPYKALTHQHVATLFEAGEQRGSIYLVYEFVPGERLNAALAGQPMNLRRALDLATQLADALAEAHALGLVHGSLTASSVVVTPKGHAKILDFGLSACLPAARDGETREPQRRRPPGRTHRAPGAVARGLRCAGATARSGAGPAFGPVCAGRAAAGDGHGQARVHGTDAARHGGASPPVAPACAERGERRRPPGPRPHRREGARQEARRPLPGRRGNGRGPSQRRSRAAQPGAGRRARPAAAPLHVAPRGAHASACRGRRAGAVDLAKSAATGVGQEVRQAARSGVRCPAVLHPDYRHAASLLRRGVRRRAGSPAGNAPGDHRPGALIDPRLGWQTTASGGRRARREGGARRNDQAERRRVDVDRTSTCA